MNKKEALAGSLALTAALTISLLESRGSAQIVNEGVPGSVESLGDISGRWSCLQAALEIGTQARFQSRVNEDEVDDLRRCLDPL